MFDWTTQTAPFFRPDGTEPAQFTLRQIDDSAFRLATGFRYEGKNVAVIVDDKSLVSTDLASIPLFMAWFVPVNGRHTPAALVHDQLVGQSVLPGADPAARADADDVFLSAMSQIDVPVLRRNLMHTAVTAATRFTRGGWHRLGIVAWGLASLLGTVAMIAGVVRLQWWLVALAALAPLLGAVLWGRRNYWQGVLAGYAVWLVAVPALATFIGYGIYWLLEQLLRFILTRGATPLSEVPPPAPLR